MPQCASSPGAEGKQHARARQAQRAPRAQLAGRGVLALPHLCQRSAPARASVQQGMRPRAHT
eukprot:11749810-Alexandrium_andersonii.AAC.1